MMKVFVVIPNWDGEDLILDCLESLRTQSYEFSIIVVDNGSTDKSVELINKNYPSTTVIQNSKNLGFAGGVNIGIKHALKKGADAVALFNNDAVADKNWLTSLVKSMEQQKAGIVTSKLMRQDKVHFDSTGDYYSVWGMPFPRGRNKKDIGQYDKSEQIFAASGGASLYSAAMLRDVGLFDEKFFAYYEDVDISFRARLAGWNIFYEPKAIAYHRVSATSDKLGSFTRYHSTKNFFMLYAKNMPGILFWKYLPFFAIQSARLAVSSLIRGGGLAYLKGLFKAIVLIPHILRQRKKIQSSRKVSTKDINNQLYKRRPAKIPTIPS